VLIGLLIENEATATQTKREMVLFKIQGLRKLQWSNL